MKKTKEIIIMTCALASLMLFFQCKQTETDKPNIIFIYTDDQADWAIGLENSQFKTPVMDKLAREGAYFINSFATNPTCTPARVSLMTSQYPSEYGIHDWIPGPTRTTEDLFVSDTIKYFGLNPDCLSFPKVLQLNGYKTGLVGKFHLGNWINDSERKYHPTNHGFDYFMGLTGGGTLSKDPPLEIDGVVKKMEGYTSDILTDYALEFINNHMGEPFFLSVNYRAPHVPWLPVPEDVWAQYENLEPDIPNPDFPDLDIERVKKGMREYMASTTGIDINIGRVLDLLKELKLEENTIVIYSSDQGFNLGHNGIEQKGNGKWITKTPHPAEGNIGENSRPNLYDNSLKVPTIIKWPGVVKPGTVIEHTMTTLDWFPTFVEMADAKIPDNKIIRGRSLVPLLRGEKIEKWDNDVYAEYSMNTYSLTDMRTYRTSEWKLVVDFLNKGRNELYNLKQDPEESNNLIDKQTPRIEEVKNDLYEKIIKKMKEIDDPLLQRIDQ